MIGSALQRPNPSSSIERCYGAPCGARKPGGEQSESAPVNSTGDPSRSKFVIVGAARIGSRRRANIKKRRTSMYRSIVFVLNIVALTVFASGNVPASAAARCDRLLNLLQAGIADPTCFESTDLTTANPATTPPNNSLPALPPFAFTPQTDHLAIGLRREREWRQVFAPPSAGRCRASRFKPGSQMILWAKRES